MEMRFVFLPLFVQVGLTFALLIALLFARNGDVRAGVKLESVALRQPNWRPFATKVANCFSNQFELPVLFYVLTILAWITRHADYLFVIMAWVFVISRILHALIHTGGNNVMVRGAVYGVGAVVLIAMWVIFAARILLAVG